MIQCISYMKQPKNLSDVTVTSSNIDGHKAGVNGAGRGRCKAAARAIGQGSRSQLKLLGTEYSCF